MVPFGGRGEDDIRELVEKTVLQELRPGDSLPGNDVDLVKAGLLDSMGWVAVLSAIEDVTGIRDFGSAWPEGSPQSLCALAEAIQKSLTEQASAAPPQQSLSRTAAGGGVALVGWGFSLGSRVIEAEAVERECGLAPGTIGDRAGIRSVVRAAETETEVSLGERAAQLALETARLEPETVDLLVVTSATALSFPSLAAQIHTRLLLRESCAALDVGGACVGVIHALATGKALLSSANRRAALVVASEVNSRRLSTGQAPAEFRGLFGDGACGFVLARPEGSDAAAPAWLGEFTWGCTGAFASSLRLAIREAGDLAVQFKGEQLASAAVTTLERVIGHLEKLSGVSRAEVPCFALHEPNPRLMEIFARRAEVPLERIIQTAATTGNLGSVTCGVNLCTALSRLPAERNESAPAVVFVGAVGPGLLWSGTYLTSPTQVSK